jgi:NodT family efflux transporter outer membrane factor (OMF) lipoprotein
MRYTLARAGIVLLAALLASCAAVGPDFEKPEATIQESWTQPETEGISSSPNELVEWWKIFNDPVLNELVEAARLNNNTLEIAGIRVLEAQAQLGIATGLQYPQVQVAAGDATYVSPPNSAQVSSNHWQFGLGASASWEIDFWGRFRRGIESADAAFLASVAAYDQAQVLLTAAVVDIYTVIRATEAQLDISHENVKIQQRSYEIAKVLFNNGADSELDMQQARTLLLSTEATIPGLEIALSQARNALSILLNQAPGSVKALLAKGAGVPRAPENVAIGIPADMLRRRPDVRQAEYVAMSQNALIGLAKADLYPSFSLTGSIGLGSSTLGDSDFGDLFSSDALTWSIGPSFVWPFLNYGRIKNNVRVQDARLQQALINYREVVLQAAREAEDAMAGLIGTRKQNRILEETVDSALRSNELSTLRYSEGFSDYERVLNAQQALFSQQQRFVTNQGDIVRNVISLYKALGGGWENRDGLPYVDPETLGLMQGRTDWGDLIQTEENN